MKLVSFTERNEGRASFGIVVGDGVIDVGQHLAGKYADLKAVLESDAVSELQALVNLSPDFQIQDIDFLPVINSPSRVFGVAMNYAEKGQEPKAFYGVPALFIRLPDSQTGHQTLLLKPALSSEFDYEGELAVIIGKPGRRIPKNQAMAHVAGYSCYMDGSVRDWQHTLFTAGKNWPRTGAFGPWLVTSDEVPDPHALGIRTRLNGVVVQDDNTGSMLRSIPDLISYISLFSELSAGDVIISGTPSGIGKKRTPPLFMFAGDTIEVEIEGIGILRNAVQDDELAWLSPTA